MNKRFSTLLGVSLLFSSAFSAYAADFKTAAENGGYYKIVRSAQNVNNTTWSPMDSDDDYRLALNADGDLYMTYEAEKKNEDLWSVEKVTNVEGAFKLKNLASGKYYTYTDADGNVYEMFFSTETKDNGVSGVNKDNAVTLQLKAGGEHVSMQYTYASNYPNIAPVDWNLEAADGVTKVNCSLVFNLEEVNDEINITAEQLNDINRGSFSLNYQFDKDHKATNNYFDKEIRAFNYNGNLYLATAWPSELNNEDDIVNPDLFGKCTFIVANPSEVEGETWNIEGHKSFGESTKFTEVRGNRLISGVDAGEGKVADLKQGYFAIENAQYAVKRLAGTEEYVFAMAGQVFGLNKDDNKVLESEAGKTLTIALVNDQTSRIVTTTKATTETANTVEFSATIVNNRTVTAEKFLSTEKASVFNIKFVSKTIADDATESEYNKYLTIFNASTLAHGADFTNLNAPESQWIVSEVDGNEFTFQNRENNKISFKAELVSTDKANVYELRSGDDLGYYAYVNESGKYVKESGITFNGMTVELKAVSPVAEAGYVTSELDNAGLVRFVYNSDIDVISSDLYITAEQKKTNKTDEIVDITKEESNAAQFSVVKFDAASTATALSDTLYAYNNYVIWDAVNKTTKTVVDGDKVAVVTYAFKQLRADGKPYYLSTDLQNTKYVEDLEKAPRFVVKMYKNGSYGLVAVDQNDSYFRDVINAAAKTLTVNTTASDLSKATSVYYNYASREFDFNILKETPGTSFNHVPQHVTMESVNGGYIAMNAENNNGIIAPVSTLKADYTKEDLTFWLDTTDSEAVTPSFMISKAGNYMYNATDSLNAYNDGTASDEKVKDFALNVNGNDEARVIFQSADLTKVEDIENYKFQIVQSPESEDEYIIKSLNGYTYVAAHNQQLYISGKADAALRLTVTRVEAPTSNEGVAASEVAVVAQNGSVVVKNAAGKNVVVSTILGQVVANEVLTSDNATINVPAGIVVVAVEGESFKVNVK